MSAVIVGIGFVALTVAVVFLCGAIGHLRTSLRISDDTIREQRRTLDAHQCTLDEIARISRESRQ